MDSSEPNFLMKINVVIPKKPKLEMKCRPTDNVLTLKAKIFNAYGLFDNFYKLHCDDVELDNDVKMIKDYGIVDGSTVRLTYWNDPRFFCEKKFFKLDTEFH